MRPRNPPETTDPVSHTPVEVSLHQRGAPVSVRNTMVDPKLCAETFTLANRALSEMSPDLQTLLLEVWGNPLLEIGTYNSEATQGPENSDRTFLSRSASSRGIDKGLHSLLEC